MQRCARLTDNERAGLGKPDDDLGSNLMIFIPYQLQAMTIPIASLVQVPKGPDPPLKLIRHLLVCGPLA